MGPSGAVLALLLASGATQAPSVIVLRVSPRSVAERAGLRPGDRLSSWQQAEGTGEGALDSPFDLLEVEMERAPRGPVRLLGRRGTQPLSVELFPDDWGLDVGPHTTPEEEAALIAALGSPDPQAALAKRAADATGGARAWLLFEAATLHLETPSFDRPTALVDAAVGAAREAGRALAAARLLELRGRAGLWAERYDEAAADITSALDSRRQETPESLATAASLSQVAELALARGRDRDAALPGSEQAVALLERVAPHSLALVRALNARSGLLGSSQARPLLERALVLAEEVAPGSPVLAATLQNLASITGDPDQKLMLSRRALALREQLAPESLDVAASLKQIGWALRNAGDATAGEEHLRRALRMTVSRAPGTRREADVLNTLGLLRTDRGDLAEAERLFRRSLEITERVQPDSPWVSARLQGLANVLGQRLQHEEAEKLLRRAAAIAEREAPGSDIEAYSLMTLGDTLRARGNLVESEQVLRRSLAVLQQENPKDRAIADALSGIGDVLKDRGRYAEAEATYTQALEFSVSRGPNSIDVSTRHQSLGELGLVRGNPVAAERHLQLALSIRRELTPGSIAEAESAHALGQAARALGRIDEALTLFRAAVGALESQSLHLGGDKEVAAHFRASYAGYYRDLEQLLLELGYREEAFATVERSRARSLLALLAARDLRLTAEIPAELESQRHAADAQHDRVLRQLTSSRHPPDAAARADLRRQLDAAREQQDLVRERIDARLPRLAAVRDPQPLDLAGVRQVLDPGTLLLAYSLGPEKSHVYAVGPGPRDFDVKALGASDAELRRETARFLELIGRGRGTLRRGAVQSQARALTRLLLRPVAGSLARAERLLVVPDGALHLLPFAALADPARPAHYVVESKPLNVVASVTLNARLAQEARPARGAAEVVGLVDPAYSSAGSQAAPAAGPTRGLPASLPLEPLPFAHQEAQALKALSPSAQVWTGADATEERAKSVGRGARVLHFACHGFLDEAFPLESGLVLATPASWAEGQDNGFLQAWEVFEGRPVDADLVTLSACQTGLGKELAGEGLLGLTWAFQYAGARSVLASLWEVADASTATLMQSFYSHLARGEPKAQALRAAQLALLRQPDTAPPFYWAAFQLVGDWR